MKFISTLTFIFLAVVAHAQVDPLYAQYINNPVVINPAYAGITNDLNLSGSYRKQWAGFDGSPTTLNVTAHMALTENKMGAGLMVVEDRIGENRNTLVQGLYSYKLALGNDVSFSFGLQGGVVMYKSNTNELHPQNPSDPAFSEKQNITKPTAGAGVILMSPHFFFGFSVPRMVKVKTDISSVESELYTQHLYIQGSYLLSLGEKFDLRPSVLLKGVKGAPMSTDANVMAIWQKKYGAGVFTRNLNTYGFITQLRFGTNYRFGYAFEMPTDKSVGTRYSSHEVTIGFNLIALNFHDNTVFNPF